MTIANTATTTEYRDLPLSILTESKTNPRRFFEDSALKELAASIRSQGVLSPLLVRPLTERSFEIVAGARRYRAAQLAEAETVPVRIVHLTDAEALEAQLIENLQRRDVHPFVKGRVKPGHCGGVKLGQCMAAKLLDLRGRRASGA
jgi:ParB family chromosome partitioning protein